MTVVIAVGTLPKVNPKRRKLVASALAIVLGAAVAVTVSTSSAVAATTCKGTAASDFNGDGISDVAVGEPNAGAGLVHVLYGTRSGLQADATASTPNDQLIESLAPADSSFGSALVALDFNGDGCTDLAVGAPAAEAPAIVGPRNTAALDSGAGFVALYFGSPKGLVTTTQDDIDGSAAGHTPALFDNFGTSLAAGDFDGDGKQDLVVGASGEDTDHGAVYIFHGSLDNVPVTSHRFVQSVDGVPPGDGQGDEFGFAIATGDFNEDGLSDLVVGAPSFAANAGAAVVMNGANTPTLLSTSGGKLWTQDTPEISGTSETGDFFGGAVATGDFRGDGHIDLAVGVPGEAVGSVQAAGMVNVIYSINTSGLTAAGNQGWNQNSSGISGTAERLDGFGTSLAVGDFNGNGKDDLAIGVPFEGIGSADEAGSINVLMGSSGVGLSSSGQQAWSQSTSGISGTAETGDFFGASLATGRIHSASRDDLVIGVYGEGIGSISQAGELQLIPGSASGLTATHSQDFNANTAGVQGTATKTGWLGFAVA